MYHAGWAWAGEHAVPPHQAGRLAFRRHAQSAGDLLAEGHQATTDAARRSSITSTTSCRRIYEILGITPPEVVNGQKQDPIDGVSMAYTFANAAAPGRKRTQYFENNGSRAIYHDGWVAATFGPARSWLTVQPRSCDLGRRTRIVWELYNVRKDFSEATISPPRSRSASRR